MLNGIVESCGKYSSSLFIKKQSDVDKFTLKKFWELLLHEKYQRKKTEWFFRYLWTLAQHSASPGRNGCCWVNCGHSSQHLSFPFSNLFSGFLFQTSLPLFLILFQRELRGPWCFSPITTALGETWGKVKMAMLTRDLLSQMFLWISPFEGTCHKWDPRNKQLSSHHSHGPTELDKTTIGWCTPTDIL